MKKTLRILIIDDDAAVRDVLHTRLKRRGHDVQCAERGDDGLEAAQKSEFDVAVSDVRMPGADGFEVLSKIKLPTILVTGHGDKESAIRAVEAGAFAFFEKPFDLDAIEFSIQRAAEKRGLELEKEKLLFQLKELCRTQGRELEWVDAKAQSPLIGRSPAIENLKDVLKRLSLKPSATVLITGETGTGKEVAARELHRLTHSHRAPFLALNCAAIPHELLESELFGHEKGSFTGAQTSRMGLAEAVSDGTLFLDEIGEMEIRLQAKLLRLIQEKSFRRVGANKDLNFRGRIIAATHRHLTERIQENLFREDLYYRLSVVTIEMPPLRSRGGDLQLLADHLSQKHGLMGIAPERLPDLLQHSWPGNIREMNNWIERASILGGYDSKKLVTDPIPSLSRPTQSRSDADPPGSSSETHPASFQIQSSSLKEKRQALLDHYDRLWIEQALERCDGNISKAADFLDMDRKNLSRRIKELQIPNSKAS